MRSRRFSCCRFLRLHSLTRASRLDKLAAAPAPLIPAQAPSHQNRLRRIPGRGLKSPRLSSLRASPGPFSARPIQPRRVIWRRPPRRTRRPLRLRPAEAAGACPRWGHPQNAGAADSYETQDEAALMGLCKKASLSCTNRRASIIPRRHPGKDTSPRNRGDPPCLGPRRRSEYFARAVKTATLLKHQTQSPLKSAIAREAVLSTGNSGPSEYGSSWLSVY
jgi:hypothetical protein